MKLINMSNEFLCKSIIACLICFFSATASAQIVPLQMDNTVSGSLSPAGKTDTYSLTTTADGQITLTFASTNGLNATVTLLDKDTATQLGSTTTAATTTLSTDGLAAGTYYVRVNSYYGNETPTYTLSYHLTEASVPNDPEPDDVSTQALTLLQNGTVTGHIGYYYNNQRDPADWYKVTTNADGLLQLKLTSQNGNNVSVYLYDNDAFTQLNSLTTAGTDYVSQDGLAAGTYYIRINSYYGNQFEPYTLTDSLFSPAQPNDQEPNDTKEQALTLALNGTLTGHIGYYYNKQRDGADWYKVTTNADGLLKLKLSSQNGSNVSVYLFDNDGATQLNTLTTAGTDYVSTDGLAAGTYYLRINSYYGNQFEPYIITDSLFSPAQANDNEPNDTKEQALTIPQNSTVTGHIGYYYNKQRDPADWYMVSTNTDGLLQLTLTSHNGSNVSAYLYDQDGTTQLGTVTTAATASVNTDGLTAGTYYIRINSYYGNQFEPYTLTNTTSAPDQPDDPEPNDTKEQAVKLNLNTTVTGHIGYYYNGQRDNYDWYKVTTNADGMLQLKLSSNNGNNVSVYLFDNDGTTQLNNLTTAGTSSVNTDGLAAGTYYLRINSYYGSQFEAYTLTDSLFTYNTNDTEPNNNPYQAVAIPANSTVTGHVNFYYNNTKDGVDWFKINYNDSTGNLKLNVNLLPHLSDNSIKNITVLVYKDTLASPISNTTFATASTEIDLTSLTQGVYYIKVLPYYGSEFEAYSITPTFLSNVSIANITLLKATRSDSCSSNRLSYILSGSYAPHTLFTVILFHNSIAYDSTVINNDTASFSSLPDGTYYASVHGYGAAPSDYRTSDTTQFAPISPAPVPADIPVITKTGRLLHVTQHAAKETFQWYLNGTLIPGAADSTYLASDSGSYTARFANACGSGAVSNTIYFSKAAQPQTITFNAIRDTLFTQGGYIVLGAAASSGLTVAYRIVSGAATIGGDTVYITGAGTITVEASQPGDDNYGIAPPVQQSFTVAKASQTITFTPVTPKLYGDAAFALHAASTSGLPVSFSVVSGPAALIDSVVAITGAGLITIKASQPGNSNYNPAPDTLITFCAGIRTVADLTGDTLVCPTTFKYAVKPVDGVIYEWQLSGGGLLAAAGDSASVTWQTPGTYTLSVKGYSSCDSVRSAPSVLTIVVTGVIAPGAVTNMNPANGAINQQLPLTLSWIPGANTNTYDLYVWDADSLQPATPYAGNLNAVSFTLINTGFTYNHTYKWRGVSRNPCAQTSGPVQQFSLVPLPDLMVSNVQAPSAAFSGQSVSISWKVSNNGPGRTTLNQKWTDAVFLSFDSMPNFTIPPNTNPGAWNQLNFPVRPLLIGAVPNVSALDSGGSYTNSLNFTLPVNYNWPLYAYVITNYYPDGNAPFETTRANDTANAPAPIIVTLSPTPDLRTDSVFITSSAFSGSTVNVGYKVRNYGVTTPAGNNWADKIYLSKDPFFDVNTAVLLTLPKANGTYYYNAAQAIISGGGQLQQDSSYSRSVPVVIPNFIFGTYFIYVVTDANNQVYEGSLENNNTNSNQIQIFLTPTPNLAVSTLSAPTSASTTQPFSINWKIKNLGYYDNLQKNQGHYLDTLYHCSTCYVPYCSPPPSNCNNCVYYCPPRQPGYSVKDSLGYGSSHWTDNVYLSADSSGLNVGNSVFIGTMSHSNPNETGVNFDDATSLPHFQYNGIQFQAGQPYLGVFLFNGSGIPDGANPRSYDVNTSTAINTGSVFPGTINFNVPDNLQQGNYYVYVLANADSGVYEYPAQRQIRRSDAISVTRPDVTVPSVSVPANAISGQTITISYSVLNSGPGSVFNHTRRDFIYMSTSPVFDASAQLISSPSFVENMPINVQVNHQVSYAIPINISGTRYFYVYANRDSSFRETNQKNNLSLNTAAMSITLAQTSNLIVSNIAMPDTVFSVTGFPFSYTVPNNGAGVTSGTWTDSIFVSCSSSFNPATVYGIAARTHNEVITSGGSYTDTFNLQIPFTFDINNCFGQNNSPAYFFVKTNANNGLYEGSGGNNNNVLGTGLKTIINPLVDHIVTSVTGADSSSVGRSYSVTWSVKNIGYNPGNASYSSWYDAVYFSTDTVLNGHAVFAGNFYENTPLNTNQSYTVTNNVTTPNLPAGDYHIFVNTNYNNGIHAELNLSNNVNMLRNASLSPSVVHVVVPPLPDLVDTLYAVQSSVAVGQPLTIPYKVSNKGAGVTFPGNWSDDFWLSGDYIPGNAGDIHLGSFNHAGALQPGQSYTDTFTAPINMTVPSGNYILIVTTNTNGGVFETDASNNTAFGYVSVFTPAPSDLTVVNVQHSDTVILGYADTIAWNITNTSANAANGIETDGIYLSKNNTIDSSAVLLGTKTNNLNILPLASDTLNLEPVYQGVAEGNYNVIVKTDILNNIVESNKDNNAGTSAKQVYVKVKELPLSVKTFDDLVTNRYYKLVIPDSLSGATILLTLTTNDSLTTNNQLYVGLGYVPSPANFDYEYGSPNAGNQQILMSSVTKGVYYITVRCTTPNPPTQHISLLAVNLPFAIVSIDAKEGGNTGNVTVKITGSLFSNNMQATLHNADSNTTVTASAVYFINSTSVYATFNLSGVPFGKYDVTLMKPDSSVTTLSKGFSAVNANNGGLITGTGVNEGQTGSGNEPGCDPGATSGLNAQLQTQIVIPPKVLAGFPFTIQINYSNPTNVDISAQVRILYSNDGLPISLTKDGLNDGKTSLYIEFTEQNGPPNIIRAGGSGSITIYAKAPANYPGHKLANFELK